MCICQVGNLAAPVEEWTVGGTSLTSLMDVERRHGRLQLAILITLLSLSCMVLILVVLWFLSTPFVCMLPQSGLSIFIKNV